MPIMLPYIPDLATPSPNCDCPMAQSRPQLAGRLEGLREQFRANEFPDKAIDLIMSSWRRKTVNNNYNSAWKLWEEWCREKSVHLFAADVSHILGLLASQFEKGKQYRSLNCYHIALSSTHLHTCGWFPSEAAPTCSETS